MDQPLTAVAARIMFRATNNDVNEEFPRGTYLVILRASLEVAAAGANLARLRDKRT